MDNNIKVEFLSKLKNLLQEYNVNISFSVDAKCNIDNLVGDEMQILDNKTNAVIFETKSWEINAGDLNIEVESLEFAIWKQNKKLTLK